MTRWLGAIRLDDPLGRGAQGFVLGGVHEPSGTPVAVKVVASGALEPALRAAFRNEAAAIAALDHPRVVPVYDQGELGPADALALAVPTGSPYLVMARARGSLRSRRTPMPWAPLRASLVQILDGLAHAHAHGIVHCDLKPANVLDDAAPHEEPDLRLADFGMALREADVAPRPGGTVLYMAPEQVVRSLPEIGPWTDLYALGWIAWELACGAHPLHRPGRSARQVAYDQCFVPPPPWPDDAPPELGPWVARLLEKDPRRRLRRAADARAVLLGETPGAVPGRRRPRLPGARALLGAGLGLYGQRAVPLQGREAECDALFGALAACGALGRPAAVVVGGAAGNGKSRLARWLCTEALETGAADVLRAVHADVPGVADGVAPMLARHLRVLGERGAVALAAVEDLLRDTGQADAIDPEAVLELVRPALAPGTPAAHAFGSDGERHAVSARLLGAMAARRPLVVWIDDGQWAPDALGLVEELLAHGAGPVLAVITVRDEALAERPAVEARLRALDAVEIEVGPLPEAQRAAFVRDLLGLHASLAARVAERTAGNPLFTVQLVGDWIQRGLLVPGPEGFVLADGAEVALPGDLHAVWAGRVDRLAQALGEVARTALEVAAALGHEVAAEEWRLACERLGVEVGPGLVDALRAARLVTVPREREGVAFVHGMLRESLERAARDGGRAPARHLACARALEALRADPGRVGTHLVAAGALEEGIDRLRDAAWSAYLEGAFARGHALLDAVEGALPGVGSRGRGLEAAVWLLRGRLLVREGRSDDGTALLLRAADRHRADGGLTGLQVALDHLATARINLGDPEGAAAAAAEAVAVGERVGDTRALSYTRPTLARIRWWQGRPEGLLAVFEDAIATRRAAGEDVAALEISAAELLAEQGELAAAVERSERAIALHEQTEPRGTRSVLLANHATVLCLAGRQDAAEAALRRALELDLRAGSRHAAKVRWLLGVVACCAGRFDEARGWLVEAPVGSSPTATLAGLARLACAAVARDAPGFDAAMAALPERPPRRSPLYARLAALAAEAWEAAGDDARAARARAAQALSQPVAVRQR